MDVPSMNDLEYSKDEAKDELLHLLQECIQGCGPVDRNTPVTWGDLEVIITEALSRRGLA